MMYWKGELYKLLSCDLICCIYDGATQTTLYRGMKGFNIFSKSILEVVSDE